MGNFIPDGVLFGSSNAHQTICQLLVELYKLLEDEIGADLEVLEELLG